MVLQSLELYKICRPCCLYAQRSTLKSPHLSIFFFHHGVHGVTRVQFLPLRSTLNALRSPLSAQRSPLYSQRSTLSALLSTLYAQRSTLPIPPSPFFTTEFTKLTVGQTLEAKEFFATISLFASSYNNPSLKKRIINCVYRFLL
jgi:hypothetical protein